MRGSKGSMPGLSATSRQRGGLRALLGKAVGRAWGTVRGWLGRNQPEAVRAQMPLTAPGTEKVLRANDRLSGWSGVLRLRHDGFKIGNMLRGYWRGPNLAELFSQAIGSRYRPAAPSPFTLALPLAHPSPQTGPLFPTPRIGTLATTRHPFPSGRVAARKTEYLLPSLKVGKLSPGMLKPARPPFPSSRERIEKVSFSAPSLKPGELPKGTLKPAQVPFPPRRQEIGKPELPAPTLKARPPLAGMLKPAWTPFPLRRQEIGKLELSAPTPKAGGSSKGMLRLAEAQGPRAESARREWVPKGLVRKSQTRSQEGRHLGGAIREGAQPQRRTNFRRFGEALAQGKGLPLAFAAPTRGQLTTISPESRREAPATGFERILMAYPSAKEEVQQPPIQGRRIPIRDWAPRSKRGPMRFPIEGGSNPDWVQGKAAFLNTPRGVSVPQRMSLTVRGLVAARPSSVMEGRSRTQAEGADQAPYWPLTPRTPLRATIRAADMRPHLLEVGWRFQPHIERSLKHPRVFPQVSPPLRREMSGGKPLALGPRRMMERILGKDFGDVRVHSEWAAARAAAALNAEAFTLGRDIFFGSGKAKFDTSSSLALLGHELTHVGQGQGIRGRVSTSVLRVRAEEREATANELALRQVLEANEPLAPWPVSAARGFRRSPVSESRARGAWVGSVSVQAPLPIRGGGPSVELARAPIGRPTPAESPAPPAEPPTPEREGRELDVVAVARQVYDLIMQRLTVERERAGYP